MPAKLKAIKESLVKRGKWSLISLIIVVSLSLNIVGLVYFLSSQGTVQNSQSFTQLQAKYPLIATRVLQDLPIDIIVNFLSLRNNLQTEAAPWGSSFGMYFEYLPTGT